MESAIASNPSDLLNLPDDEDVLAGVGGIGCATLCAFGCAAICIGGCGVTEGIGLEPGTELGITASAEEGQALAGD
jgi:hypothetical protein